MTLVEKSIEEIKKLILDAEYDQDRFLPSEGELSKRMGVSRATTREAVRSLEVRGFVKRIHGKGIQVVDDSVGVLSQSITDMFAINEVSLDDLLEVRETIEIKATRFATERATEEDFVKLRKYVEIMEKSRKSTEQKYLDADLKFHLTLVAASKNSVLTAITKAYTSLMKEQILEASDDLENIESQFHYHRTVLEALESRNADAAEEAMLTHLSATFKNRNINSGQKK